MSQRAEDILEIIRLTDMYARSIDLRRFEDAAGVYTEDAVYDSIPAGGGRCEGRGEMVAYWTDFLETVLDCIHAPTNRLIDLDGPDEAHGSHYLPVEATFKNGLFVKAVTLVEDTYVRTTDGWLISGRVNSPIGTHNYLQISRTNPPPKG